MAEPAMSRLPGQMALSPNVSAKVEPKPILAPSRSLYIWTLDSWLLIVKEPSSAFTDMCASSCHKLKFFELDDGFDVPLECVQLPGPDYLGVLCDLLLEL